MRWLPCKRGSCAERQLHLPNDDDDIAPDLGVVTVRVACSPRGGEAGLVRPVTDAQVRKLMEEMSKHGHIGHAAMKADMDRKTARKYVAGGKLPSETTTARDWRTRPDPFEEHWPEVEERLRLTPELEAKTLFELLQAQHPERYADGQLRTLQRRVRW